MYGNITNLIIEMEMELKQRMTFSEMRERMEKNSFRIANRVNVGKYARQLGYRVYKPMIKGKLNFFYVKMKK